MVVLMDMRFEPARALGGKVDAPADKSISHRAALLGAMASEPVRVENYLHAADTTSTLEAVRALGALVEVHEGTVIVRGTGLREAREPEGPIDVGNAGTLMRLLPGWLASQEGRSFTLDGDDSIRRRPVDRIAAPLRQMGAELEAREGRFAPLTVHGSHLRAISFELEVASAQVKSCILLAGLAADGATTVGEPTRSRDHTERMLLRAGVAVHRNGRHQSVSRAGYRQGIHDPRFRFFFNMVAIINFFQREQKSPLIYILENTYPGERCTTVVQNAQNLVHGFFPGSTHSVRITSVFLTYDTK